MKIFIDFRNTYKAQPALGIFTYELFRDLTQLQPRHQFVFVTGTKKHPEHTASNTQWQLLRPSNIKWLDKARLQKKLRGQKADCLVTIHPDDFSLTISRLVVTAEKITAQQPARLLFTGHTHLQDAITVPPALATTTHPPLTWAEAESIKTRYAGGRSFFLFTGAIDEQHQLVELLKAFSIFKKWQQSNMQLLITGSTTRWTAVLEEKMQQYKYRNDVVLLKNTSNAETAKLVAACYALLYPAAENIFPFAMLWALQQHKAMVASATLSNRQLGTEAEWVEPGHTAEGFAKAMILLYKDEGRLQALEQQAKEQAPRFSRQLMMDAVWRSIEQ